MTPQQKQVIDYLAMEGNSGRKISRLLGIPKSTVNDYLKGRNVRKAAGPRILFYDVETSPSVCYSFGRFKQNISQSQIIQEGGEILTWSAKWFGDKVIHHDSVHYHNQGRYENGNDFEVVDSLSNLIYQADIIVHQNGDRFDLPVLNTRRVKHGLPPLPPKKSVDTLKIARAHFRFGSNRLESLAIELGLDEGKIKTDFSLWSRCMDGDVEAFEEMIKYNERDVEVLEQVYLALRPWDQRHPNLALYMDAENPVCPKCGSDDLEISHSKAHTGVSQFDMFVCGDCGAYSRGRTNLLTKDQRSRVLSNIAK